MATSDHRSERVDHLDEGVATFDDALVVKRHVVVGFLVADLGQTGLEVFEVAPHVAVVRTESSEVDVGEEEHPVHPETAVTASVSGQVHRVHGDAATEIEHVAISETLGVGPRHVVEFVEDCLLERGTRFARESVDLHQPVDALCADDVGIVNV